MQVIDQQVIPRANTDGQPVKLLLNLHNQQKSEMNKHEAEGSQLNKSPSWTPVPKGEAGSPVGRTL